MFRLEKIKYKHILGIPQLTFPANKITCLLGPSGSGKTTLLCLLNKMISPTSGNIYYHDQDLKQLKSTLHRRKVCMLSQQPIIFEGKIRDNLLIGLKFHEKPFPEDHLLRQVLSKVQLDKALDGDCINLSGGEKQRLALARILLLDPEVYLLDEPSASLDDDTEALIIKMITQEVKEKAKTLIMVTHSKAIAKKHAELVINIAEGQRIDQQELNHE